MRAMASALVLAEKYHTKLKVIWPMNKWLNSRFDRLFEPIEGVEVVCSSSPVWRISHILAKYRYTHVFFPKNMEDGKDVMACLEKGEDVYIHSYSQFYEIDGYRCFRPVKHILDTVDVLLPKDQSSLVGIHIRRTDNQKSIEMSPTSLFIDAINQEINRNPDVRFYLATDSREDERILVQQFGNRIMMNHGRDLRRNSNQGIIDALVDLTCLSRCTKILGSYWSSFSETAAVMGGEKELEIMLATRE